MRLAATSTTSLVLQRNLNSKVCAGANITSRLIMTKVSEIFQVQETFNYPTVFGVLLRDNLLMGAFR